MNTMANKQYPQIKTRPQGRRRLFSFCLRHCLSCLLSLTLICQSAIVPAARAANSSSSLPTATLPPAPPSAPQSNVNLTITALNTAGVVTDSQTLVTSGNLAVTIKNLGADAVNAQFRVIAFEDRNGNGAFNQGVDLLLGSTQFTDGVPANSSASLGISLSGTVTFKGNIIYVVVDSENAVVETNENNNIRHTGQNSTIVPTPGQLNPVVEWKKDTFSVRPDSNQVYSSPAVIDLNGDSVSDIIFSTFALGTNDPVGGILRVISGANGNELWSVTNPSYLLDWSAGITVANIDSDAQPEVIARHESGSLIAFEHDTSFKWKSPIFPGYLHVGSAAVADLDHDGVPEIVFGNTVLNNDGSRRWVGTSRIGTNSFGPLSLVADIDLDGDPEIVAGPTVYRATGTIYWDAPIADGFPAVGNFDADQFPEIVVVTNGNVYLLEHTGQVKWGPVAIPGGGRGGAPTVADLDGDGQPEIGIAGYSRYVAIETDGSIKWQQTIQDYSSNVTGSSGFDFEGDGSVEVIYGDEVFLRIYRGADGQELYRLPKSSGTGYELPVIVDVDSDGRAEIVAIANQHQNNQTGIYVIGGADNNWVNTRRIWNQHTYHITNINEDGTIPRNEQPNWLTPGLNNFRLNTFAPGEGNPTGAPDLTASYIRKDDAQFPTSTELTARIGNGGGTFVAPGVRVSFYTGDPAAGGTLIGTTQTTKSLDPGQHEDVKVVWNNPTVGLHPLTVVADDNGSGQGTVNEGNENNNKASANIALGIGPFTLVDDLIARFKDGAVDLLWSPIAGATGYNVYRRTGNGAPQLIKQNHPRANFADSGLANGTTYYYTVRWVDAAGRESGTGTEMSATPTAQANRNDAPPTILSAPDTQALAGSSYAYDARALDPNRADTLSYALPTPLPTDLAGMKINAATGLIEWTPTLAEAGYHTVPVRVQDSRGRFATQTYQLFVEIPNRPPAIDAGPDQTVMVTASASLNGRALDDGLPFGGTLTTAWTKVSGLGTVTFANPSAPQTTATFSQMGTYVLRLAASDSQLTGQDEVTINVVRQFASRLYTLNGDFNEGSLSNVDLRVPNQLQLSERAQPFNFIWVAVSSKGTAVKINTETGQVLGEYYTSPAGQPKNPSRTTVDLNGNVWVANRDGNSVTRIGLVENGQCVDRNGNGRIDTSAALNDIKDWTNAGGTDTNGGVTTAQDECVINYVRVNSSGTRHVSVDRNNDVWVSGTGGRRFDLIDGRTGLIKRHEPSVGYGGYGGLIDKNGIIWSATNGTLLRWDTAKPLSGPAGVNWTVYGGHNSYGLGIDSQGNVWNSEYGNNTRKYAPDGSILGTFYHGRGTAQGVAVDKNGHVWVAHSLNDGANTVGHLKNDGSFIGNVTVGSGPTGVAVDAKGKVWATNHHSGTVSRIDPHAGPIGADGVTRVGAVDFTTLNLGGNLYNYSDMTGSTLPGAPNTGTWTVVFDSQIANAEWGRIGWNAQVCGDGALTVTAASSNDNTTFSTAHNVTRGQDLTVPNGRYLRISVIFRRATTGESPVLYDLSVGTDGYTPPAQTNTPPVVNAGSDVETALFIPIKLKGSVCDDGLPNSGTLSFSWSKVSGPGNVTFANANALATTATTNTPGTYVLHLTATDGQTTTSDELIVTIEGSNRPPVISSQPPTGTCSGRPYSYQVVATDPNAGDVLTYTLPIAPAGMTINSSTGLIQWAPNASQGGNHNVKVVVTDLGNNQVEQTFTVNVTAVPSNNAPAITSTAPTGAAIGFPYNYAAKATDSDACDVLAWSLDVAPAGMTINLSTGLIEWVPNAQQVGNHNVTVRVRDFSGAATTQSFTINVLASVLPPTVAINSPAPGSNITQLTSIIGSVSDPNNGAGPALNWKLEYRRGSNDTYKTISSGTGTVNNAALGQFDPTLLPNDVYYIRLQAEKGIHIVDTEVPYNVTGDLKLGNFTISFTDLTIPVAGIPIVITRSYDSLDTSKGEFGAGWRLGFAGKVTDSAREDQDDTFRTSTRVYVTRPDGRRVGFTFAPVPIGGIFVMWRPAFRPDAGVTDTLEVAETALFKSGDQFFDVFDSYNPNLYTFKTKEGLKYEIDEIEGLKRISDTNGNTLDVTPTGLVSSTGVKVGFERDAQGRIAKIVEPTSTPSEPRELKYTYDPIGNLIQFTDQANNATKYFYQQPQFPHYLTKIEDPLNRPIARNVFDNQGRLIGICDGNGDPATLNGCTKLEPNAAAKIQTIYNARGFRTDLILDERGNMLTERRWLDGTNYLDTVRTYDPNNNLLTETDPAGNVKEYTYDSRGNRKTEKVGGRTTTYTYNSCNKVSSVTDAASNLTTYIYDDRCNLRFVEDALRNKTEYRYNAAGQRTEMIDAIGNRWEWAYDANSFLQSWTDPFGKAILFNFNSSGDLLYRIDRNNRRIDFRYDAVHRPANEIWATTPQRVTTYTYNTSGQLTGAIDPDSSIRIDYDNLGRQKSVDNEGTPGAPRVIIAYSYDANGNVTRVQDSLGGITDYSYDALDRLSRVTQSGTDVNEKRVDITYDKASFLREMRRFSNLAGTQGVANTSFDYDCGNCGGRINSIRHRKASDNSVIHDLSFQRDELGNISSATDAEGTHTYTYDAIRRLKAATHSKPALQPNEFYTYDATGNRVTSHLSASHTYSYQSLGKGNRLQRDDRFTYQYDNEGNLVRKSQLATGSYTEYRYDFRNRLSESIQQTAAGAEVSRAKYSFDSLDRRVRAIEGGDDFFFGYDGLNPILKIWPTGAVGSRRAYNRSLDNILADEANGQTRWFITDQLGSVRDLLDNQANPINHYRYDSFGQLLSQTNPEVKNDILFAGRELTLLEGASYFRARYYDPFTGRFQQEDPYQPFHYAYAESNPMVFIDPLGLYAYTFYEKVLLNATITILTRILIVALFPKEYRFEGSLAVGLVVWAGKIFLDLSPISLPTVFLINAFLAGLESLSKDTKEEARRHLLRLYRSVLP